MRCNPLWWCFENLAANRKIVINRQLLGDNAIKCARTLLKDCSAVLNDFSVAVCKINHCAITAIADNREIARSAATAEILFYYYIAKRLYLQVQRYLLQYKSTICCFFSKTVVKYKYNK